VQAQANAMALDPAGAPLALGDDLVFLEELVGGLAKGLFRCQKAGPVLAAQLEIPVLGDLFGQSEAFFLGADSALLAANRRGAMC
jgi:hypothetical protein